MRDLLNVQTSLEQEKILRRNLIPYKRSPDVNILPCRSTPYLYSMEDGLQPIAIKCGNTIQDVRFQLGHTHSIQLIRFALG